MTKTIHPSCPMCLGWISISLSQTISPPGRTSTWASTRCSISTAPLTGGSLASELRHVVDDVVNAVLPVDGRRPNLGRLRVRAMLGTLTVLDFGVATSRARYSGLTAAHSSALEPCAAERWIAAGDASLSFDPLSAQGLLHAPFTGLAAAEAADAYLPATAKRRPGRNAQGPRPLSGQKRRGSLHRNAAWRIALINIPRKCASEPRRS